MSHKPEDLVPVDMNLQIMAFSHGFLKIETVNADEQPDGEVYVRKSSIESIQAVWNDGEKLYRMCVGSIWVTSRINPLALMGG